MTKNVLTAEQASQILKSRRIIDGPGMIMLKATNITPHVREDGTHVAIVNFNGMTPYHEAQAKKLYKDGKFDEACNQNISASPRVGKDYTPSKNEYVNVLLTEETTGNGVKGLFVKAIQPIKPEAGRSFSLESVEEEVEVQS